MVKSKVIYLDSFKSTFGTFRTAATDKGLTAVMLPGENLDNFKGRLRKVFKDCKFSEGGEFNKQAEKEILTYLNGSLKKFTVKLDWQATEFQKRALLAVGRIPYGKTKTYGEVAKAIGSPNGSRAVGMANAANSLPIIIPCHRVVASNGLGGYGGGLEMKIKLLKLEGAMK